MRIDSASLSSTDAYRLMISVLVPRPIAWVGSRSREGVDNLAPFSYFMGVSSRPPALAISVGRRGRGGDGLPLLKDTARNLLDSGELTVSMVPRRLAEAMNQSSAPFPPEDSEFLLAGLSPRPAERVAACYPAESPVAMECRVLHHLEVGSSTLFVAEILLFHVDEALLLPGLEGQGPVVDSRALDPLARLGGQDYAGLGEGLTLATPRLPPRGSR